MGQTYRLWLVVHSPISLSRNLGIPAVTELAASSLNDAAAILASRYNLTLYSVSDEDLWFGTVDGLDLQFLVHQDEK